MHPPYQTNSTINRTHLRPTLRRLPLGLYDLQALPPYGWCTRCGKEIYRPTQSLCPHCRAMQPPTPSPEERVAARQG